MDVSRGADEVIESQDGSTTHGRATLLARRRALEEEIAIIDRTLALLEGIITLPQEVSARAAAALTAADRAEGHPATRGSHSTSKSPKTTLDAVSEILRQSADKPLRATEVLERLLRRGVSLSPRDPHSTALTALTALAEAREERGDPEGIYAIGEDRFVWRAVQAAPLSEAHEPPVHQY